jgi:hypothetical protein
MSRGAERGIPRKGYKGAGASIFHRQLLHLKKLPLIYFEFLVILKKVINKVSSVMPLEALVYTQHVKSKQVILIS